MTIATLSFDRTDAPADLDDAALDDLRDNVIAALNRYFPTFNDAAFAQAEHRYVRAHVEGDPTLNLFSMNETFRAAVHANAKALNWEAFVRDAQTCITPYCFSIRFSRD